MASATWAFVDAWSACENILVDVSGFDTFDIMISTDYCYEPSSVIDTDCMMYVIYQIT